MNHIFATQDLIKDEEYIRLRCDSEGKILVAGTLTSVGTTPVEVTNTSSVNIVNTASANIIGVVAVSAVGSSYSHLSSAGTTVVRSGSGILRRVSVNQSSLASSITLYDNTVGSGNKIAVIDTGSTKTLEYNLNFIIGLTAVIAGSPDITIIWD